MQYTIETIGKMCCNSSLPSIPQKKGTTMLYTIAIIFLVMWLLGLVTAYSLGGFIHILLVIAIISVLLRVISGRKVIE